jgi:hypothetical protein
MAIHVQHSDKEDASGAVILRNCQGTNENMRKVSSRTTSTAARMGRGRGKPGRLKFGSESPLEPLSGGFQRIHSEAYYIFRFFEPVSSLSKSPRHDLVNLSVCSFKDDLLVLQKIPVLPALIESQKLLVPEDDDFSAEAQSESVKGEVTLLEWISQRDDFMDYLFDVCAKGLAQVGTNKLAIFP